MKIAIFQFTSQLDFEANLTKVKLATKDLKKNGVEAVFLAECFYSMSDGKSATPHLVERDNQHYQNIKNIAIESGLYLLGGSAATLREDGKVVNRAYNFAPDGTDLGFYDKRKLFRCDINDKKISEANTYTPGTEDKLIEVMNVKLGLNICFDLRFSQLALNYRNKQADVLLYPSAFTVPTGQAHWHTLLRARAIESQCFVIAAAQWGQHNQHIQTYGHSLVISPWGDVLLDLGEGEKLGVIDMDVELITEARKKIMMNIESNKE